MKRVCLDESWPESWKYSYPYDLVEVYSELLSSQLGYTYAYRNRRDQVLLLANEVLSSDASICDVAAAQGNFSILLAELGYKVTWNDLRSELEGYVKLKYENGNLSYKAGNILDVGFDSLFDCILISEIIEHVAHPDKFLKSIAKLVRPGGYVIMTTPNGGYFFNTLPKFSECADPSVYESTEFGPNSDDHIFLLHPEEINKLGSHTGLVVEKVLYFTNSLTAGFLKTGVLLRVLPEWVVMSIERLTWLLPKLVQQKIFVHTAVRFRKPG